MKRIAVEYNPFPLLRYSKLKDATFPQYWSEITPKQLIAIACLIKGTIDDTKFMHIMTGLPKRIVKRLDKYHFYKLAELLSPFHDAKPFTDFILKRADTWNEAYFCPSNKLKDLSFGQFMFVDTYYADYVESSKQEDLDKFIACLYLPKNVLFKDYKIENHLTDISKLDYLTKEAILINYSLIREWVEISYPMVFVRKLKDISNPEDENEKEEKQQPKNKKGNGWLDVLESIVGDDIIQQDKYSNLPIHTVLRYITKKIKDSKKRK